MSSPVPRPLPLMPIRSAAISPSGTAACDSLSAIAVRRLMSRDIQTPLSALRAALESLVARANGESATAAKALEQLARVERAAQILCEHAHPREPVAVRCTVEEIARSAMRDLSPEQRSRVCLALEEPRAEVEIDAMLLARSLARIVQGALADGTQEILLHSHVGADDRLIFTIVDGLDPVRHQDLEQSFEPSSEAVERVEVALAVRDVRRMGGSVSFQPAGRERTCVSVEIPAVGSKGRTP